jgi:hypothetical protein
MVGTACTKLLLHCYNDQAEASRLQQQCEVQQEEAETALKEVWQ